MVSLLGESTKRGLALRRAQLMCPTDAKLAFKCNRPIYKHFELPLLVPTHPQPT